MNFFQHSANLFEWMVIIQVLLLVVLILMGLTSKQDKILAELQAIRNRMDGVKQPPAKGDYFAALDRADGKVDPESWK